MTALYSHMAEAGAGLTLVPGAALTLVPLPAVGSGSWLAMVVILMVLGFAFLGAELFVIPGFGVAGIIGVGGLVTGVSMAWVKFGSMWGTGLLMLSLVIATLALAVLLKTKTGKGLILDTSLAGTVAVSSDQATELLGVEGVAVTVLRPTGSAELGDARVEVETDGAFLPKGTRVRVVAVKLGRVVVEAACEPPAPAGEEKGASAAKVEAPPVDPVRGA